jgi:hypothetical protein
VLRAATTEREGTEPRGGAKPHRLRGTRNEETKGTPKTSFRLRSDGITRKELHAQELIDSYIHSTRVLSHEILPLYITDSRQPLNRFSWTNIAQAQIFLVSRPDEAQKLEGCGLWVMWVNPVAWRRHPLFNRNMESHRSSSTYLNNDSLVNFKEHHS